MTEVVSRRVALSKGLKRYFTGKPCKHGHISERSIAGACLVCSKINVAAWRARDPDRARSLDKIWRQRNPEKMKAKWRARYNKDPEKQRERSKMWKAANLDRLREYHKAQYASDPKKHCEKSKLWRQRNPDRARELYTAWINSHRDRARELWRARHHRTKNSGGKHTADDIAEIFRHQKHKCAYCRLVLRGKPYHVDHIVALSRGGTDARRNIQILCPSCNLRKHARDPMDFARLNGMLL